MSLDVSPTSVCPGARRAIPRHPISPLHDAAGVLDKVAPGNIGRHHLAPASSLPFHQDDEFPAAPITHCTLLDLQRMRHAIPPSELVW
ncbi:hypothetical protein [Burkholderia ubonensis]|uniref:Uncharacterized protein n=1 Tax=Burkholderia ubonensis subsp. mesacidophila TaxID=265293 RepID=A0A2A4FMD1_9BURK|nr:hypothetical protein [Burkholderia ubonensis]PCE33566.1 hypothetical protein BZL54_04890 [Burkholderia ubonensis subsp. mesacidophila]